ncbi:RHS repeat domain-containing protein [Flavobacterium sp. HNIBRBA15423]|uniref:RHS repeat domain-containing protein n=1 Tax=Flavobacterium sp. HNIBRBA15423 TaxID=3458683 RepID=UPI004044F943
MTPILLKVKIKDFFSKKYVINKIRYVCLFLVMIFFNLSIYSQQDAYTTYGEIKNVIPEGSMTASPDVSSFQKINIFDMNLYTGKADVSIPLYTIKSGDIEIPIGLQYNTGGIKVDDVASSVGLNWSLNAGGSIVRVVKDNPDNDVTYALYSEYDWDLQTVLFPSLGNMGFNRKGAKSKVDYLAWGAQNRFAVYSEDLNGATAIPGNWGATYGYCDPIQNNDLSPDLFIVNAPSLSSKFLCINTSSNEIYPNNSSNFTTTFLENPSYKMESTLIDIRDSSGFGFMSNGNHQGRIYKKIKDFYEFTILNSSGMRYKFNEEEVSESILIPGNFNDPNYSSGSYIAANQAVQVTMNNYSKKIHTWNLSEIESLKTNKKVNFGYETYANDYNDVKTFTSRNITINNTPNPVPPDMCLLNFASETPLDIYPPSGAEKYWEKNPKRKRLSSITFNEGIVNFIYTNDRLDFPGEKSLDEIIIKNFKDEEIEHYYFNYSYFSSKENCSEPECKRLRLDSISKVSGVVTQTHLFDYEYIQKLPRRGSLEQDFFGFYNNNGLTGITSNSSSQYTPKLYFYPNKNQNSVLPFQKTNDPNYTLIPGQIDLTPNSYSLTGLLKKITYPLSGSLELEYENNIFYFESQTYVGAGARVKKQKLTENGLVVKNVEYKYEEENGICSGYLNNLPVYGYLNRYKTNPFQVYSFLVYDKPKGNLELTNGSYIGYSRVKEFEVGNGYTIYEFNSPKTIANIPSQIVTQSGYCTELTDANNSSCVNAMVLNSAYPGLGEVDNDYKRGKLINKEIYNSNNIKLLEEQFTYLNRDINSLGISKSYIVPKFNSDFITYNFKINSSIKNAQYLTTKIVKNEYFNGHNKSTTTDYTYTPNYPFIKEIKQYDNSNEITSLKYYPFDVEVNSLPYVNNLVTENRISEVVKESVLRDNQLLNTSQNNLNNFNGLILSKSISTSKGVNSTLIEQEIINLRDSFGNILQYQKKDNAYVAIIWGYNKTQPIAKIENATYAEVQPYEANLQTLSNGTDEASLITALNNLRTALPNAMVTTYTYNPLVGVTSITDPRGYTTTYQYDDFNRLESIKDANGIKVSKNEYHYKN